MTMIQKRILINRIILSLSSFSAVIGMGFLFWILYVLVANGVDAINWNIFIFEGAPPGYEESGLKQALIGQMILIVVATLIGVPLGVLAGTYLSEYGQKSKLAEIIRDISDIMMSAPSIVIGAFIYAVIVMPMGHFSGWAGVAALAIIMLPIILRTTDDMLQLVPSTLREAAFALGAPKYKVIMQVVYRGAKAGVLTGILLGIARVGGDGAAAVYVVQRQLPQLRPERADGVADGDDVQLRDQPVRRLAEDGMGRRLHPLHVHSRPQHRRPTHPT